MKRLFLVTAHAVGEVSEEFSIDLPNVRGR